MAIAATNYINRLLTNFSPTSTSEVDSTLPKGLGQTTER